MLARQEHNYKELLGSWGPRMAGMLSPAGACQNLATTHVAEGDCSLALRQVLRTCTSADSSWSVDISMHRPVCRSSVCRSEIPSATASLLARPLPFSSPLKACSSSIPVHEVGCWSDCLPGAGMDEQGKGE